MKTTTKKFNLAMLIALFATTSLFAFEDSVKVNGKNTFNLFIQEITSETHITLKDQNNMILFDESINTSAQFAKTFNLELLPEGDYNIVIENGVRIKTLPFSFTSGGIQLQEKKMLEYFKPFVNKRGSRVFITQYSPSCDPLHVTIYNLHDELVYEDMLKGKKDLGKIYDFSKSSPGTYRIALESKGMSSEHLVDLYR